VDKAAAARRRFKLGRFPDLANLKAEIFAPVCYKRRRGIVARSDQRPTQFQNRRGSPHSNSNRAAGFAPSQSRMNGRSRLLAKATFSGRGTVTADFAEVM